jgi:type II secretory ATPase GspE/PulE/Tfp pilus assembly ATPase PilB-like protein
VNKVLLDAIKRGVSDLHFEPYEKIFRIRFRGDGMLFEYDRKPLVICGGWYRGLKLCLSWILLNAAFRRTGGLN